MIKIILAFVIILIFGILVYAYGCQAPDINNPPETTNPPEVTSPPESTLPDTGGPR